MFRLITNVDYITIVYKIYQYIYIYIPTYIYIHIYIYIYIILMYVEFIYLYVDVYHISVQQHVRTHQHVRVQQCLQQHVRVLKSARLHQRSTAPRAAPLASALNMESWRQLRFIRFNSVNYFDRIELDRLEWSNG